MSIDLNNANYYYAGMQIILSNWQNWMPRTTAARIGCTIAIGIVAQYTLIYIVSLILGLVIGHDEPIGASNALGLMGLETQFPIWLFLGWTWVICVLVQSQKMGFAFRSLPEALALPPTYLQKTLLRFSENLVSLTGAKRVDPRLLPVPAPSYRTSRTCPPSPLPDDSWPSTNPRVIYH